MRGAFETAAGLGLTCRPMTDDDLPFLFRLYASTRSEEVAATGWPPEVQIQFLRQQFDAQHHHYTTFYPDTDWWVVEHGGSAVGRLYVEEWPSQIRVLDIALLPEARGKGFGTALIADLFDRARASGKKVSIHVEKNNPAMRLYHHLGFVKIEDQGVYDLMEWTPGAEAAG